jgi:hypothetical protein
MTNNNLVNPGCQYELKNNVTYGSPNIYINSNYWGTMNTQHIDSVIYDFFDFANQSVVYYLPILSSPTFIDTTCKEIITEINKIASPLLTIIFYPNPASNNFTIAFDKIIKNGMIEIFNVYGECIKQVNIHNDSKQEVNLESIPNGIFLIRLNDGEKFYCKKLIVEHN